MKTHRYMCDLTCAQTRTEVLGKKLTTTQTNMLCMQHAWSEASQKYVAKVDKYFNLPATLPRPCLDTPTVCTDTLMMWINHTARESESMYVFHLWGREVTSSIYFRFNPQCSALQPGWSFIYSNIIENMINILHWRWQQQRRGRARVTFRYVWNHTHSECVCSSHVSIQVNWLERKKSISGEIPLPYIQQRLQPLAYIAFTMLFMTCYAWYTSQALTCWGAYTYHAQAFPLMSLIHISLIRREQINLYVWKESCIYPHAELRECVSSTKPCRYFLVLFSYAGLYLNLRHGRFLYILLKIDSNCVGMTVKLW